MAALREKTLRDLLDEAMVPDEEFNKLAVAFLGQQHAVGANQVGAHADRVLEIFDDLSGAGFAECDEVAAKIRQYSRLCPEAVGLSTSIDAVGSSVLDRAEY